MKLKDKVILLTAEAEDADGRAIAEILRQEGAEVRFSVPGETDVMEDRLDALFLWEPAESEAILATGESEVDWDTLFKVYVKDPFFMALALADALADGGRIIVLMSSKAYVTGEDVNAVYTMVQGARRMMVNALAQRLGKRQIGVTGIAAATDPAAKKDALHYPLHGRVEAGGIAGAVTFLCSADASYINGTILPLDAGNGLAFRRYEIGK